MYPRGASAITAGAPRRSFPPIPLVLGALVAATAVVLPLIYLAIRASDNGWDGIETIVWRARTWELIVRSLSLTALVTTGSLLIGIGCAWLVTSTNVPLRGFWRVVFALPLALPSYVAAWAWIGYQPQWSGLRGATLVLISISYPYVYIPVLSAMRTADPAQAEVARSLGLSARATFLRITLRQIRIAATGGALLVALYTLSEFGAVSIMRYESLTHVIYRSYRASFDRTPAAILGCVLVAISMIPLIAITMMNARHRTAKIGSGSKRPISPIDLKWARWPIAALAAALITICLGVPSANLLRWLRAGTSRADWSDVFSAAGSTLVLAVLAGAATVVIALPVAMLAARYPGRLSGFATTIAYAGHGLPGVVVALSMVFFGIRLARPIYQTTSMLVFAYVVLFLSLAIGAIHQSIANIPPILDELSQSLGVARWRTWILVTFRLASPGMASAMILVMLATAKELPATLLLRPIGTDTLATRLWTHTDGGSYAAAAPYAAGLIVLAAIPTAVLTISRRDLR